MWIAFTIVALVAMAWLAISKWLDREAKTWRDWDNSLPSDERRKVQEQLYKEHI